ncbi:MAG TPA: CarD family transcriptional regulator [Acidimicrobiia bacterium]|nr:CarD family transcriptional regulator [Acidimicrobiia bacterium]
MKKAAAKKAAPKSAAKKAPAKKAPAKKPVKRAPARKTSAKKTPAKKTPAKKTPAKKTPAPKAAAKKKPAPKPQAKKAAPVKQAATKASPASAKKAAKLAKTKAAPAAKSDKKVSESPPASSKKQPAPPPEPKKEPAPVKRAPISSRYAVGDKVVHPQHGAATVAKRLKREFGGQVRDYFVLDIATESLTVMVPVETIDGVVRSVISKTQSRHVLNSLREEPQEAGANWSRWYKVLTEKMYSGDIFQVAEVVRDLTFAQQTKGISPALKRMLSKARMTLISELSFSLEVDDEEATRRLDKALPKIDEPVLPPV